MKKKKTKRKRRHPFFILILFLAIVIFGAKAIFFNGENAPTDDTIADDSQEIEFKDDTKPKKRNWKKIKENLFLDLNSLQGEKNDYVMGVFKLKNINEKANGKTISYALIELGAYCSVENNDNIKKIDYPDFKYFNKNDELIKEINPNEDWKKQYQDGNLGVVSIDDIENGEAYFDALCK